MFELDDDFDVDANFLDDVLKNDEEQGSVSVESIDFEFGQPEKRPRLDQSSSVLSSPHHVNNLNTPDQPFFNLVSPVKDGLDANTSLFVTRKVVVRKFPGPAGLLPQRQANTSLVASNDFLTQLEQEACPDSDALPHTEEVVLSQGTANALEGGTWAEMETALGSEGKQLISTINLAAVRERAKLYRGRALRVPFLAACVASIDASTPDPSVKLQDATGEMAGALHRAAWEVLSDLLVSGSVLVLTGVGVVPASLTNYYINITSKNIVAVFSPTSKDVKETRVNDLGDCSSLLESWHRSRVPPPLPARPVQTPPLQQHSPYGGRSGWSQTSPRISPNLRPQSPTGFSNRGVPPRPGGPRFLPPGKVQAAARPPANCVNNSSQGARAYQSSHNRFQGPMQNPRFQGQTQGYQKTISRPMGSPAPSSTTATSTPKVRTLDNDLLNQSIVESLLEGIDMDSLFDDF